MRSTPLAIADILTQDTGTDFRINLSHLKRWYKKEEEKTFVCNLARTTRLYNKSECKMIDLPRNNILCNLNGSFCRDGPAKVYRTRQDK